MMVELSPDGVEISLALMVDNTLASPLEASVPYTATNQIPDLSETSHTTRRQQNLLSPIYRLPSELLAEIFYLIVEAVKDNRHKISVSLGSVSSRWYSTTLSAPRLWSQISSHMSLEMIRALLERSKQAPLHVTFHGYDAESDRRFLDLVIPHLSRWGHFYSLSTRNSGLVLKHLANKYAPRLETLHFRTPISRYLSSPTPVNLSAPALRDLFLLFYPFPLLLEAGLHSRLRKIHFKAYIDGHPFRVEHYRILLSSAPQLQDIRIGGYTDLQPSSSQTEGVFEVSLPNLEILKLCFLPWCIIGILLSSISITPDQAPTVVIDETLSSSQSPSHIFPELVGQHSLLAMIRSSASLHAIAENFDVDEGVQLKALTSAGGKVLDLTVTCSYSERAELLFGLITSGSFEQVKEVYYNFDSTFFSLENLNLVMPSSVYVERLDIVSPGGEETARALEEVIKHLSWPVHSDKICWVYPRLRHLTLSSYVNPSSLKQLVHARNSNAVTSSPDDVPRQLELIDLVYVWKKHLGEIEDLKGTLAGYGVEVRYEHSKFG